MTSSRAWNSKSPDSGHRFRPDNLYFGVEHPRDKDAWVFRYLKAHGEDCGIIYCSTRKNVDELYDRLRLEGISAARYHAGLSQEERQQARRISSTTGPGDCGHQCLRHGHRQIQRTLCAPLQHAILPGKLLPGSGRAGRDGEPSECILLFSPQDVVIQKFLLEHKEQSAALEEVEEANLRKLYAMEHYCRTTSCLRQTLLHYFGEEAPARCNHCSTCNGDYEEVDMTEETKSIVKCIHEARRPYGITLMANVLAGSRSTRVEETGLPGCGCSEHSTTIP